MKRVSIVFYITIALVIIFVMLGALQPTQFEQVTTTINAFLSTTFGWYYMWLMAALVIITVIIAISPYGKIRLGKDHERPDFSTSSWIAMLFSAGLGIGLVFYGAAEPLSHAFTDAPFGGEGTEQAFKNGLAITFFHWGIHGWAMYGLFALALAFFQFRKDEPGLISATLKPLFGDKMKGPFGNAIDVLATFATIFGVATSLGFGAVQINGGLNHLFGIEVGFTTQLIIVIIVTILFLMSAWSGLSKGIKYLSNANMVLAILLFFAVLFVGPTLLILNMFTETVGLYLQNIVQWSFRTAPLSGDNRSWFDAWTLFYWAWWISWAPFVGMFIARVSRGRTIRQFMIGVIVVPTLIVSIWFATFGTTAGYVQNSGTDLTQFTTELVLFNMFDQLPFSFLLSIMAILLIITFFVTSADSATFVLGMQSTNGSLTPPNGVKIALGLAQSSVALILLYVGGLTALQNTIIAAALPFSFVMILMMVSLIKALNKEVASIKGKNK
ncbi:BCCT family transporter [Virgibacillus oceani]|uniref:Glycine betaine transporter OpuD n=1 Tax=Virgibacillus oceani TaxID=1479511 RepID=A0A917HLJ8_9BACI|nr:BCCT family transporter [Virgibacillus oceani]GGG83092.1 glycine betaine transporter OpuD [Virgibacillus oceani]